MEKLRPVLSQGMLIVGVLLILAGLGWGLWTRLNQPPDPVETDAGAVVLAVTAPLPPTRTLTPTPSPSPSPEPTQLPPDDDATPDLLPEWSTTPAPPEPTEIPTRRPPTPTPTPTPTSPPPAESPPTRVVAPAIELDARVVPMGWEMVDNDGAMVAEWIVPNRRLIRLARWPKFRAMIFCYPDGLTGHLYCDKWSAGLCGMAFSRPPR